jgi:hypothetical protein
MKIAMLLNHKRKEHFERINRFGILDLDESYMASMVTLAISRHHHGQKKGKMKRSEVIRGAETYNYLRDKLLCIQCIYVPIGTLAAGLTIRNHVTQNLPPIYYRRDGVLALTRINPKLELPRGLVFSGCLSLLIREVFWRGVRHGWNFALLPCGHGCPA